MGEVSCETMCGVLRLGDVHMGVCYIILSTFVCLKTSTMEKKFSKVQFRCLTNRRQSFFPPFIPWLSVLYLQYAFSTFVFLCTLPFPPSPLLVSTLGQNLCPCVHS